ncbi:3'(2'),5'-bisphosphate nucleotidase CysQ [Desulfolutivibrio sulfoxidireducens]|uniref:3'(2'),5'-bisphosphate nucleotidase CysQ n=1 Tax=Desulfolutivibrio sulfoxidireducens TaxID=2773299 RepID=UPI00159E002E|nr:3'(2'),5'-bisphosphate nucleotidase CysQ [Desulfolutivibrio sulfoxidireducens]QLA17539.1 3'(2'),5'-bisphosphate nucleotidase CysQ [Desulfolutivibrio sulfoxidireducens]QLA21125.1 3'(2'),5'-bisphosphate nucleotidase CysQ [Desulfolutivibrio sulfoxidireducens]
MTTLDIRALCGIARHAGREILRIAETSFAIDTKDDNSPVTIADKTADEIIRQALATLSPDIPVLSEESAQTAYDIRKTWTRYWLVDPLDGTKEFIKKNGEYTVNIALMEKNSPAFGVIHVPTKDTCYFGGASHGALRIIGTGHPTPIRTRKPAPGETVVVAASRSHPDPNLQDFLRTLPPHRLLIAGSAYKFCLLAQGDIHLYPRFNPTMEWDTAAGQAIVEGAGGVFTTPDGAPFPYNKPSLRNGPFLARA